MTKKTPKNIPDEEKDVHADAVEQDAPQDSIPAAQDDTQLDGAAAQSPEMDDWAAALAEQTQAANQASGLGSTPADQDAEQPTSTVASLFQPLAPTQEERAILGIEGLKDVPVEMTVVLGRARVTIRELLQLGQGSVVDLMTLAGEPLDVLVNGHLIAQGEVVVVGENYGVRLTDILTPSDRLQRLTLVR